MSRCGLIEWVGSLPLLLLGCHAHAKFEPLAAPPRALSAIAPEAVKIVPEPAQPSGVRIGQISAATGPHAFPRPRKEETLELLRAEGAEHGCEVLVLEPAKAELYASSDGTPVFRTYQKALCYVKP